MVMLLVLLTLFNSRTKKNRFLMIFLKKLQNEFGSQTTLVVLCVFHTLKRTNLTNRFLSH